MDEAIAVLKAQGAVIVDPADIPSVVATDPANNFLDLGHVLAALDDAKGKDADCSVVFKYGMKRDFNAWLASLGAAAPVKTLTELRLWNLAHQQRGRHQVRPGAARHLRRDGPASATEPRYEADRAKDVAPERRRRDRRGR